MDIKKSKLRIVSMIGQMQGETRAALEHAFACMRAVEIVSKVAGDLASRPFNEWGERDFYRGVEFISRLSDAAKKGSADEMKRVLADGFVFPEGSRADVHVDEPGGLPTPRDAAEALEACHEIMLKSVLGIPPQLAVQMPNIMRLIEVARSTLTVKQDSKPG